MSEADLATFILNPQFFAGAMTALAFEETVRRAYKSRISSATGGNQSVTDSKEDDRENDETDNNARE